LKKTYEDMQNYQRLDKWEFAAMATGTLSLFYKKIAHDEGESASPENGRNLLKQNSKQIKDIAASLNKIAKDVTLHDVVNYNTDPVRLLESSTDPQSLIEKARMGLANIWQSKDVILPSVFGQDGWDITQWPEAVLEKVVQFTKFIEGVWGEYAPVVFANLKKAGIKIYEFTGDRIMLAYEAARDSEVARIIVEHTGDIIGFLPSLGWKLVNSAALFAEKGIEFTAEMIPQALEAMQQIGEQYLEAWTVQLSNPDQRVEMNDCDSLVNAIKNEPDLRKAIKNNYGLIRDQDIDIFLERIWGDDGAYFAELVSLSGASPDFVTSKQLTHQQLKLVFQDSWRYLDGALENLTKAVVYGENAAVGLADAGQQMFFWGTGLAESIVLSSDLSRQASEKVSEFLEMAKIDPNLAEIPQPNNIDFLNQLVAEKSNNTANQSEVWTYEKLVLIARDSFKTAMSEKYNMDYPPLPPLTENEIFVGIKEAKEQFSGLFIDNQGNDQVDFINQLLNAGPGDNIDCYGEDIEMPEYTGENDSYEYVGIKIEALAKSIIERKVSKIQI
jgi:hypothetical protein